MTGATTAARSTDAPAWLDTRAYPFRHHWMTLTGGHRLHYVDEGGGEPILFVHGTPTWSFEWRHLLRALATTHRVIAPDHLGFGLSDRPANVAYTPEAHAERLAEVVERLGLRDVTLVVHDYGGPIGLPLALEQSSRVRRLVLLNTWMWSFAGDRQMERTGRIAGSRFGRFLYRWLNVSLRVIAPAAYADRAALTPEIHKQYLAVFPDRWSRGAVLWPLARALLGSGAYYERLWSNRERLRELPALIVWGTKDPALEPHQLDRWRSALSAARVVELPVGHWPHEESPDAVLAAVREFLSAEEAPRRTSL